MGHKPLVLLTLMLVLGDAQAAEDILEGIDVGGCALQVLEPGGKGRAGVEMLSRQDRGSSFILRKRIDRNILKQTSCLAVVLDGMGQFKKILRGK